MWFKSFLKHVIILHAYRIVSLLWIITPHRDQKTFAIQLLPKIFPFTYFFFLALNGICMVIFLQGCDAKSFTKRDGDAVMARSKGNSASFSAWDERCICNFPGTGGDAPVHGWQGLGTPSTLQEEQHPQEAGSLLWGLRASSCWQQEVASEMLQSFQIWSMFDLGRSPLRLPKGLEQSPAFFRFQLCL